MLEVATAAVLVQRSSKRVTEHLDWLLKQISVAEVNGGPKNVVVKNPFMPLILACLHIIRHNLGRVWLKQQHSIRSFGTRILTSQPCCTKLGATALFQLTSYPPPHHGPPPPFKRPLHGVRLGNRLTKAAVSVQLHWDLHREWTFPSEVRWHDWNKQGKRSKRDCLLPPLSWPNIFGCSDGCRPGHWCGLGPLHMGVGVGCGVRLLGRWWGWVVVAVSASLGFGQKPVACACVSAANAALDSPKKSMFETRPPPEVLETFKSMFGEKASTTREEASQAALNWKNRAGHNTHVWQWNAHKNYHLLNKCCA